MISWLRYAPGMMLDLRQQLRAAMKRSGLTRKQIADETGVSYSVIHGFAGGDRDVLLATASRIAAVVRVELRPVRGKRKGR